MHNSAKGVGERDIVRKSEWQRKKVIMMKEVKCVLVGAFK